MQAQHSLPVRNVSQDRGECTKDSQTLPIIFINNSFALITPNPIQFECKVPRSSNNYKIKQRLQPMNFMSHTPHRQEDKHDRNRNSSQCQPRLRVRKADIQNQQLHTESHKEEKVEFQKTRENFVVKIVAVDFSICAKSFED